MLDLIHNYYVSFENKFKEEYINWQQSTEAFEIWQSKKKDAWNWLLRIIGGSIWFEPVGQKKL